MPADAVRFWLNDRLVEVGRLPGTTTLLRYLRDTAGMPGTKEGCAEGDCGACSVVVLEDRPEGATYRAVNSCLVFLPMLQGKRVYTVEALRERRPGVEEGEGYHPVQEAMVATRGSQCGYCTPGIVMSMFEACYRDDLREDWQIDDQLCGNLCRCTGYRPIREAAQRVAGARPADRFLAEAHHYQPGDPAVALAAGGSYLQPGSEEELWDALDHRPRAQLIAGGTDLALVVTKRHQPLDDLIGLEGIDGMRVLDEDRDGWRVGAGVSLTRLLEVLDGKLPALEKMLRVFGSRQIRSRATVGGNLCTCSPIGDLGPVLVALGAQATVRSRRGDRTLPLQDFLAGYRKPDLGPGEVLWSIHVPRPAGFCASYKVSKRRELDISTASAGMYLERDDQGRVSVIRLSYGGLSARPAQRARHTEAALSGRPWTEATIEAALPELERDYQPIDDLRGTAAYRRLLARNLLRGFYLDSLRPAAAQLTGGTTSTVAAGA